MSIEPPPRMIAIAIADLVADRAREAWHYLDRWAAGLRAGVLTRDLRNALDVEIQPTEAQRVIGHWAKSGARGVLIVCSGYGLGKTLSAVRWLFHRHDKGRRTVWWRASEWPYSFDDREAVLGMLAAAPALVVDDLGEGESAIATMAADQRSKVAAKLVGRFNDSRPTLILSNATDDEVSSWLGGRMVDRMRVEGGVYTLTAAPSMRKRESADYDDKGRSPRWHAAAKLVDLLGVERDGDEWSIGRKLEAQPWRCKSVISELGLDEAAVIERARELLEQDKAALERLATDLRVKLPEDADLTYDTFRPIILARVVQSGEQHDAEIAEYRRGLVEERRAIAAALVPNDSLVPPANPPAIGATRQLAERYGVRAVLVDDDEWAVIEGGRELARGRWTQAQAWWAAAELLRPHLTRPPALSVVAGGEG